MAVKGELEGYQGPATIEKVASLCRRRGFVYPSSDIYGGLGSSYDYGHYGVLLNQNIKAEWQRSLVQEREDVVLLDSAIILNPQVWVASGHVAGFSDPLVDCRTCKLRFRADHLADAQCGKRPSKKAGETADCDLTEARQFNLMFETSIGPVKDEGSAAYLRPETAQGIFINFKNVTSSLRVKPPFGIAQIGKSFRNEITPGSFTFVCVSSSRWRWSLLRAAQRGGRVVPLLSRHAGGSGISTWGYARSHLSLRAHATPTSSRITRAPRATLEYLFPIGWSELEGVANRGDYDLRQHTEHSGTKLEWIGHEERYVPHVIEPALGVVMRSAGVSRRFLTTTSRPTRRARCCGCTRGSRR